MRNRLVALTLAVLAASALSAFAGAGSRQRPLTVYAAASLTEVFSAFDRAQRYSFAGSNALETQIRNGAPADLFASAAPLNTQRLYRSGIGREARHVRSNRLVLIVPRSNPAGIRSVYDLRRKRVKLVVAGAAVPVGGYTRTVLRKLGLSSVLSKVVSQESDVKAVTGKVALGQADAGFVYATDARPVGSRVAVIGIPARAQPRIRYEIAVVARSGNKTAARAWIRRLLSPRGQNALTERRLPADREGLAVAWLFRAALARCDRRRAALPAPADRRGLPARSAGRALRRPRQHGRSRRDPRDCRDERARHGPHPRLRHARRVLDLEPSRSGAGRGRHAGGAAARAPARGGGDRSAGGVRAGGAARGLDRGARDRHRLHEGGRRPGRDVRGQSVLPPHGGRGVRGGRSDPALRGANARRRSARACSSA